jgi:hypothetical protein
MIRGESWCVFNSLSWRKAKIVLSNLLGSILNETNDKVRTEPNDRDNR